MFEGLEHLTHKQIIEQPLHEIKFLSNLLIYMLNRFFEDDDDVIEFLATLPLNNSKLLEELLEHEIVSIIEQIFTFLKTKRDDLKVELRETLNIVSTEERARTVARWTRLTAMYFVSEIAFALAIKRAELLPGLKIFPSKCMEFVRTHLYPPERNHYLSAQELKTAYAEIKRVGTEMIAFIFRANSKEVLNEIMEPDFAKVEAKLDQV